MILRRVLRRAASGLAVGTVALSLSGGFAGAQESLTLIDGSPAGVRLAVSASGEVDPVAEAGGLALAGLTIGPCTVAQGTHDAGPILLLAEANDVLVHHTGGSAGVDYELTQGESVVIPAGRWFTVANVNSDGSMDASVLMLAVTASDATSGTGAPDITTIPTYAPWPETSRCTETRHDLETRFSVLGRAGSGASMLYLGIGVWDAGATTEGYELADERAAFNLLVLSGGLPTAGQTSGLAVSYGPGDVASDSASAPVDHEPFLNPGAAPLIGIVFGTTADDRPVFVPAE